MGNKRRTSILNILTHADEAISASKLAQQFGVSRQIIVGDIALLRAQGKPIKATSKGYIIIRPDARFISSVAVDHLAIDTEDELLSLVNMGVYILDVTVEHPIYGEITGQLNIKTPQDVHDFMNHIKSGNVELLSTLTQGVHLHTLSCSSKEAYHKALQMLKEKKYLVQNL